jgi:creatinine amidohydrolase
VTGSEKRRQWADYRSAEYAAADADGTIAVLPLAAIEQHGPHLPVGTDALIAVGMLDTAIGFLPHDLDVRILPVQAVGKSNEHTFALGTLTLPATVAIEAWTELGLSVGRAGVRKLIMVSSHGGNMEAMGIVATELRVRAEMLAVTTSWSRFGLPEVLIQELERRHGVHGGEVETSLMLHFRPDLVDMEKARDFPSLALEVEKKYRHLRTTGPHAFAWVASDLNPDGVVGNASAATAEKGRLIAGHRGRGFVELLEDVRAVPLAEGFGSF